MQSWTIILFGYNESKTIKDVFFKSKDIISQITNDYEIIIIDDGSTDNSVEIILEIKRKYTFVKTFFNKKNIGIGKTLLTGYLLAKKEKYL